MKNFNIQKILPYILTITIFYIGTLSYFYPELLDGKTLAQTDIVQFEGMSKRSVEIRDKTGEQTLWNDAMFSGLPDYLIATGVPERALQFLKKASAGFLSKKASGHLLFLSFFCFWILLLAYDVKPWIALVAALAYGFTSYNIVNIDAGHFTKMWAIQYSALVLAGLRLTFKGNNLLLGMGLTAAAVAMQVGSTHYQITYYLIIVCLAFGANELIFAIREKQLPDFSKKAGLILLAGALAAGTSVARLWMTMEYTPYSIRGEAQLAPQEEKGESKEGLSKEYAFRWSYGKLETFSLLIPYVYGGGSGEKLDEGSETYEVLASFAGKQQADRIIDSGAIFPLYHGEEIFTGGTLYLGAVFCFLFLLGMLLLDDRHRWWILTGVILMMMISWGRHLAFFNYFLFDYIPGFNKFRSVSMALSLVMMLMALAGTMGLQRFLEEKWTEELRKKLLIAGGATIGISLIFVVFGGMMDFSRPNDAGFFQRLGVQDPNMTEQLVDALEDDRESALRSDALRSAVLILISAGALYLFGVGTLSKPLVLALLGILLIGDVWMVSRRYIFSEKFEKNNVARFHQLTEADKRILQETDAHYRVFTLGSFDQEANTSYFHKSIGGYFAAKMLRYRDLIERQIYPEQNRIITQLREQKRPNFSNTPVINMLNAKYIKFGNEAGAVLVNPQARGNAWFVGNVEKVQNADEEITALDGLNTANTAVIDASEFEVAQNQFTLDSSASISLKSYSPRRIEYTSQNSRPGLAVFSEIYYPKGWQATIDGEEAEILRVNYVLRALEVPAGEHEIVFTFDPDSYVIGSKISSISGWLVLLLLVGSLGLSLYKEVK